MSELLWADSGQTWEGMDFSPVPTGDYTVVISEAVDDISGTGKRNLKFAFSILEGEFKNRKVFKRLWYQSANQEYVKDCFSFVKSVYVLLGAPIPAAFPTPQDLALLVNRPFTAKIIKKKGKDADGHPIDENEVIKMTQLQTITATNHVTQQQQAQDVAF